jgi:glycosyltransferase involved in cell wall biosynthesis
MVYIRQDNKRAAGARNTAIGRAQGEFLAFLDSDDSWSPDHLASQMRLFEEDPALDFVYSNGLSVGDPSRPREFMQRCPSHGTANFEALVIGRCQIPVSTVVVRKNAIVRAGMFDETLPRCDDYDMWLRTAFYGAKLGYTEKVQARLNGGRPGSLSGSRVRMIEAYLNILEKAMSSLPLSEFQRKLVQNQATEVRARYCLEEGKYRLQRKEFDQAKNFLREANLHFRRSKVSLVLLGLAIAPKITSKLASLVEEIRN